MEHNFDVRVSQQDADVALKRFILRGLGWETLIASILCLAYVAYDMSDGKLRYLSIVILTLLSILVLICIIAFITRRKQMVELLKRLGDSPISYTLDESEFASKSALGSSSLKWEMIKKLWIDPDLIMVFYARNGYTTIPANQIPDSALEFLAEQVKRVGGSIRDNKPRRNKRVESNG